MSKHPNFIHGIKSNLRFETSLWLCHSQQVNVMLKRVPNSHGLLIVLQGPSGNVVQQESGNYYYAREDIISLMKYYNKTLGDNYVQNN